MRSEWWVKRKWVPCIQQLIRFFMKSKWNQVLLLFRYSFLFFEISFLISLESWYSCDYALTRIRYWLPTLNRLSRTDSRMIHYWMIDGNPMSISYESESEMKGVGEPIALESYIMSLSGSTSDFFWQPFFYPFLSFQISYECCQ